MVCRFRPVMMAAAVLPMLMSTMSPAGAADPAKVLTFIDDSGRAVRTQTLPDPHQVHLRSETVDLRHFATKAADLTEEAVPLIVAFDRAPSSAIVKELEAAGAQVVGHLPPSSFLIRADAQSATAISRLEDLAALARFQDTWKVSERLLPGPVASEVEIVLFNHADFKQVLETARAVGQVQSVSEVLDRHIVRAVLSPEAIDTISSLADVEMIDAAGIGGMMNNEVRVVLQTEKQHFQANQAFYNPIYNIGVFGAGQVVTLADTGLEAHEVYAAAGKIFANVPAPNSCVTSTGDSVNHGTGVAATLLGDKIGASGLFGTANDLDGLSLQSTVAMLDIVDAAGNFCPPTDYALDLFLPAWQVGSMIHSNSWGHWAILNNPTGTYSWRSQVIDDYMSRPILREQVILFAAGNAGATWPGNVYLPYSLSDEAHSKNAIVVGGSGNGNARDFMYLYSSRGPTDDCLGMSCGGIQRVKPDLLAPADYVVDTADTAGYSAYSAFSGTSIATPGAAAAATLIRDYFAQGIYPVKPADPPLGGPPSSALIKAMMVNATVPIYDPTGYEGNLAQGLPANAYPNYDQGYGRPVLDNVLEPAGYRKLKAYEDDSTTVNTGDVWTRTVTFKEKWAATCNTLRITLAWNDPEGTLAAGPKLVNNLDLEVDFGGRTYKGNHRLTGNTAYDKVNNVEDVFLPMGSQTLFSQLKPVVRVYGSSVPQGPQPFAVVATYGTCADNIPCPPPQGAGGCYRGPGDVVPGSNWNPGPGCGDQEYSSNEYDGNGNPYPFCEPPTVGPIDAEPKPIEPGQL